MSCCSFSQLSSSRARNLPSQILIVRAGRSRLKGEPVSAHFGLTVGTKKLAIAPSVLFARNAEKCVCCKRSNQMLADVSAQKGREQSLKCVCISGGVKSLTGGNMSQAQKSKPSLTVQCRSMRRATAQSCMLLLTYESEAALLLCIMLSHSMLCLLDTVVAEVQQYKYTKWHKHVGTNCFYDSRNFAQKLV